MNASALAATAAPPPSPAVLAGQAGIAPLTRVSLAYIEQRIDVYLRFGEPARTIRLDRWRRVAVFLPRARAGTGFHRRHHCRAEARAGRYRARDRKSTRLNSRH